LHFEGLQYVTLFCWIFKQKSSTFALQARASQQKGRSAQKSSPANHSY
jgi:hypothetical protein